MATKSFLKQNIIRTEKEAIQFINALEEAEKAKKKDIKITKKVKTIKDNETIKNIFT